MRERKGVGANVFASIASIGCICVRQPPQGYAPPAAHAPAAALSRVLLLSAPASQIVKPPNPCARAKATFRAMDSSSSYEMKAGGLLCTRYGTALAVLHMRVMLGR